MTKARIAVIFFLALFTLSVFVIYHYQQPVTTYSSCKLCDGNQYLQMYYYFNGQTSEYKVIFPCNARVFVPMFASLLPVDNALDAFFIFNLIFSIAAVISIYLLWEKLKIPFYLIMIGLIWLCFHWTGLIRLNIFDPATVDVPLYLIQALFIFIFVSRNFKWLWLLCPVAVLQKESIIALLVVFLLFALINNKYTDSGKIPVFPLLLSLILCVGIKYMANLWFPSVDSGKSSVITVLYYIKQTLLNPFRLIRWLVAISMAFGPFIYLGILNYRRRHLSDQLLNFLTIMSLTYLLFGIVAGEDMTRIVFLGFPFIMTWILIMIRDIRREMVAAALLISLLPMRIFSQIPDPGQDFPTFASWYPEFAEVKLVCIWFILYIVSFSLLLLIQHFYKERK
ncbi:MAG: hypothetical protein K2X86_02165 [Cytophagaceae bacterium]|nr:hypothetical protein [Cytophagaceae bacterium]